MKQSKRFLIIMIVLALVIALLPLTVIADEGNPDIEREKLKGIGYSGLQPELHTLGLFPQTGYLHLGLNFQLRVGEKVELVG